MNVSPGWLLFSLLLTLVELVFILAAIRIIRDRCDDTGSAKALSQLGLGILLSVPLLVTAFHVVLLPSVDMEELQIYQGAASVLWKFLHLAGIGFLVAAVIARPPNPSQARSPEDERYYTSRSGL